MCNIHAVYVYTCGFIFDIDSSSGYVIDSLVRNSYLKCEYTRMYIYHSICVHICVLFLFSAVRSSLNPLDIVYKDPQLDVYTLRRSYHSNSDGESNYSDSELWLSTQQKRFSRKSKRLSQRLSQRSSTVSHPRSISESYPRVSEWTLDFGSDVSDNLSSLKNEFSPRLVKLNSSNYECHDQFILDSTYFTLLRTRLIIFLLIFGDNTHQ